jgi:hypothetical protein
VGRLIVIFIIAFLVYAGLRMALAKKNLSVRQFFAIYFATVIGLLLLFLGVTGRLHPLFVVLGAVLPFVTRLIPWLMRATQLAAFFKFLKGVNLGGIGGAKANAPLSSEITSKYIHMVLFHDTGMMDGTVLEGTFKGAKLAQLELPQLTELLAEISHDADSANLLTAYMDRDYEGWQQNGEDNRRTYSSDLDMEMTESQALEILGLDNDASHDDVVQAHRRMMQKMHPDRGGSTYLAAKINAAKDLLDTLRKDS